MQDLDRQPYLCRGFVVEGILLTPKQLQAAIPSSISVQEGVLVGLEVGLDSRGASLHPQPYTREGRNPKA